MLSLIPKRFLVFTLVGVSGIVVNSAMLLYVREILEVPLRLASLVGIQTAIFNNFIWNRKFTWTDRSMSGVKATGMGLIRFTMVSWIAGAMNWVLLMILTHWGGLHYFIANLLAILAASILNFFLNDLWTFKSSPGQSDPPSVN